MPARQLAALSPVLTSGRTGGAAPSAELGAGPPLARAAVSQGLGAVLFLRLVTEAANHRGGRGSAPLSLLLGVRLRQMASDWLQPGGDAGANWLSASERPLIGGRWP